MSFKSEAQRRRCAELVKQGKITQAQFDEWESKTPTHIPERKGPKNPRKPSSMADLKNIKKDRRGF